MQGKKGNIFFFNFQKKKFSQFLFLHGGMFAAWNEKPNKPNMSNKMLLVCLL